MTTARAAQNADRAAFAALMQSEIAWLSAVIDARIRRYFGQEGAAELPPAPTLPRHAGYTALLDASVEAQEEREPLRLLFALALAPYLAPEVLDVFFLKNEKTDRGFTEFGGIKGLHHAGFLPTGETALFLFGADDITVRVARLPLLDPTHRAYTQGPLRLAVAAAGEPAWSARLGFSESFLRALISGQQPTPDFSAAFPARPLATALTWTDLVLDARALAQVREIITWARDGVDLLRDWGLSRHVKPGYSALFHGPSGSGKTLAAALLGKELGCEVYRVDLTQVVSSYSGETEKALANVFAEAERRRCILFFDEADALFGQRTQPARPHDRNVSAPAAFVLERIEAYAGIVILATDLEANFGDAVARRLHAVIPFPPPNATQRLRLWRSCLGEKVNLDAAVDLAALARRHKLTGGQITNAVRHACIIAVQNGGKVTQRALDEGCRREVRNARA